MSLHHLMNCNLGHNKPERGSVLYRSLYVTIEVILAHNSVHQRVEIFIFLNWDLNINIKIENCIHVPTISVLEILGLKPESTCKLKIIDVLIGTIH